MKIGFTGTRNGMTQEQIQGVIRLLDKIHGDDCTERLDVVHGDCIGSDANFHKIVRMGYIPSMVSIAIRPGYSKSNPSDTSQRAFCNGDVIHESKPHFARNRDIVNETDLLIATPPCFPLPATGGTRYTVGYAADQKKPYVIIYPDGTLEDHRNEISS